MIRRPYPAARPADVAPLRPASTLRILAGNSLSLIATQVVTSVLGAAYWWYAARHFSPTAIGVAGAVVSAMLLIGSVANLGLGTLMMGELPRMHADRGALIAGGLVASSVGGMLLGLGGSFLAPLLSHDLAVVRHSVAWVLAFSIGCGATAAATVLDQALVGLFRGRVQLWRNAFFSLVKLVALVPAAAAAAGNSALAIYATWAGGIVLSIVAVIRAVRLADRVSTFVAASVDRLRTLARATMSHFAFNLALQIPSFTLPILAVVLLSARENASFYIAWQVVALLFVVPVAVTSVLYPLIAREPHELARITRLTLLGSLAVSLAGMACLEVASGPIMRVFGERYAATAVPTLEILALGAVPMTIKSHYVAVYRITGRLVRALPLVWSTAVLELVAAGAGAHFWHSLRAFSALWVAFLSVEALVMLAPVVHALRPDSHAALRVSGARRG